MLLSWILKVENYKLETWATIMAKENKNGVRKRAAFHVLNHLLWSV